MPKTKKQDHGTLSMREYCKAIQHAKRLNLRFRLEWLKAHNITITEDGKH